MNSPREARNSHSIEQLFGLHLVRLVSECEKLMNDLGIDAMILGSGSTACYFEDDQNVPFRENAMFSYFCPLKGPGHFLLVAPQKKPHLVRCVADDFWHARSESPYQVQEVNSGQTLNDNWLWLEQFSYSELQSPREAFSEAFRLANGAKKIVFLGNQLELAQACSLECNPFLVVSRLAWMRSFKSDYEIECLRKANELAAVAHRAAQNCFLAGGSEFEIYLEYLRAGQVSEWMLPYGAIIGIDENAAVLHYEKKSLQKPGPAKGRVLLIDAGLKHRGYGSDITRTHLKDSNTDDSHVFYALLNELKSIQQDLCEMVRPGISFLDLHLAMHLKVAELLLESGIVLGDSQENPSANKTATAEYAKLLVEQEVTHAFIPHGIGHLLGLFVHDVAGHAASALGQPIAKVPKAKNLRSYRTLEPSMVLTIEPGLYFIESLLHELRSKQLQGVRPNWRLISELLPFGGIRIEDNIVVTEMGHVNLTREFLV